MLKALARRILRDEIQHRENLLDLAKQTADVHRQSAADANSDYRALLRSYGILKAKTSAASRE